MLQSSLSSVLLILLLAIAFSLPTLWLLNSEIKYALFIFEVLVILGFYVFFSKCDFKITISKRIFAWNSHHGLIIDTIFVAFTVILLLFNVLFKIDGVLQSMLSLFVTSFLPGYAILNIIGLTANFSKLEKVVLSFVLSYAFTGLISLGLLFAGENTKVMCILGSYILLGLLSGLKHKRQVALTTPISFSKNSDLLALLLVVIFYCLNFAMMYPGFALLAGTDISRHYGLSIILNRTPDLYWGSVNLLAHLYESSFIAISNSSLILTQTSLLLSNLILPLAFYIMAKPYLGKIDARLPSIATLFWVLFTNSLGGFSWLYFVYLKLSSLGQTQMQLLAMTADKTYNGTIYGVLGTWFVPSTLSLVILLVAIFLLSKKELPASKYFLIFSVTIAALYLTHVTEAVVFTVFLAIYAMVSKNGSLKLDAALKGSLIGFVFASFIFYVFSQFTSRFFFNLPLFASIVLPSVLLTVSLIVRHFHSKIPSAKYPLKEFLKSTPKIIVILSIFAYVAAMFAFFSLSNSFHTWQVDSLGVVPWFMYPLILGITGVLSLPTLYYIAKGSDSLLGLKFFVAFMFFAFFAGALVSIMNIYFFSVDYWEKRFVWFIKIPLALLSPIPLLLLIDRLRKRFSIPELKTVASIALIGTVCLYGVSTTFLNMEYWNDVATNPENYPSSVELDAIDNLKKILDNDPKAWVLTVTDVSSALLVFAAPGDTLILKQLIYDVHTPELALTELYRSSKNSHPYIYIANRDKIYLNNYPNSFFSQYLLTLSVAFKNSEVTIYNASQPSYPQLYSETALILPFDQSIQQNTAMAYFMLSYDLNNYTVVYDTDHNALNYSTLMLSFDPPQNNILSNIFQDNFNQMLDSWSITKGSWSVENGGLLGGKDGVETEGFILSSVYGENFTATVNITPSAGNITSLNYARLVYSWVDSKNYRIADIFFNSNGYVHVLFRDYKDGVETVSPTWPGLQTDLKWSFNDTYTVQLNVSGTSRDLSINGTSFLNSNTENIFGRIGLSYYRFNTVIFDSFSVNYFDSLDLRPVNDYLDYLNSGGRLIVLNTNGAEYFSNHLFSTSNSTFTIQQIMNGNITKTSLPFEVSAPVIKVKESNVTVLSYYSGSGYEIPLITQKDYENGGKLFYFNVYPIVQASQNSNQSAFTELIGTLLDNLNLSKNVPTMPLLDFNGYAKNLFLQNTQIETNSILQIKSNLEKVEVKTNISSHIFYNVTTIELNDYSSIVIESGNASIQNGNGFYTEILVNLTFSIKPSTVPFSLKISSDNGTFTLFDVNMLSCESSENTLLQVRTPTVSASDVTFEEFYLNNYPQSPVQFNGQNLNVTSHTKFSIMISDNYQAISNLTLGEFSESNLQSSQYDMFSTLPTALFCLLLLVPVIIVSQLFGFKKSTSDHPSKVQ